MIMHVVAYGRTNQPTQIIKGIDNFIHILCEEVDSNYVSIDLICEHWHWRWVLRALNAAIALKTKNLGDSSHGISSVKTDWAARLWYCIEASNLRIEAAILSGDGLPLITFLLSGGIVWMGLSCKHCGTHISQEQYSFVLKMYRLARRAGEALYEMSKSITGKEIQMNFIETDRKKLRNLVPADSAVALSVNSLLFKLLATVLGRVSNDGPTLAKLLS
jgi:hypothetical protein